MLFQTPHGQAERLLTDNESRQCQCGHRLGCAERCLGLFFMAEYPPKYFPRDIRRLRLHEPFVNTCPECEQSICRAMGRKEALYFRLSRYKQAIMPSVNWVLIAIVGSVVTLIVGAAATLTVGSWL